MSNGPRIPKLEPAALGDEQRTLYDAIAGGRRAQGPQLFRLTDADGRLEGPFNAFLLQPRLGSALQALGADLDDTEYREAEDHLGPDGLFELLTLVGYYATLALQLRVFRVPGPEETTSPA